MKSVVVIPSLYEHIVLAVYVYLPFILLTLYSHSRMLLTMTLEVERTLDVHNSI